MANIAVCTAHSKLTEKKINGLKTYSIKWCS